jgi:hypothetical protein
MAIYNNLYIYVDGQLLAENQSLDISLQSSGSEEIISISDGWLGHETGAHFLVVSGELAVPFDGSELDAFLRAWYKQKSHLTILEGGGGKTLSTEGYFINPSRRSGVGQNLVLSFMFHGTPDSFK